MQYIIVSGLKGSGSTSFINFVGKYSPGLTLNLLTDDKSWEEIVEEIEFQEEEDMNTMYLIDTNDIRLIDRFVRMFENKCVTLWVSRKTIKEKPGFDLILENTKGLKELEDRAKLFAFQLNLK